MHQKLVPDPFLILVNNPKLPLPARNLFKNTISLKGDYQKDFKKLCLSFLWNQVPFNGQDYEKQRELELMHQSLFSLQSKFRKIPLLAMYYLTKLDVIYSCCWVIPKITSTNHKLIPFLLSFWIWKGWKGREKLQKLEYLLRKKRTFWIK